MILSWTCRKCGRERTIQTAPFDVGAYLEANRTVRWTSEEEREERDVVWCICGRPLEDETGSAAA